MGIKGVSDAINDWYVYGGMGGDLLLERWTPTFAPLIGYNLTPKTTDSKLQGDEKTTYYGFTFQIRIG